MFNSPIFVQNTKKTIVEGISKMKENSIKRDVNAEGKDKAFLDIDRMINEGLSGGSVHRNNELTNIEEARKLADEEPPHHIDK